MSDFDARKNASFDELKPVLSLKVGRDTVKEDESTKAEQEALWNRSLDYFNSLKPAANQTRTRL